MRIAIGYINTLVPHSIFNGNSGESHINQQTDMAMSNSVDPYSLYTARGTATEHFMMQIDSAFGEYYDILRSSEIKE